MKLGLGLYRHMLTRENFQFARQAGATHIVAHLVDYFPASKSGDDQPTGTDTGWGRAGDPDRLWTVDELKSLRREINSDGLELEAIENFDPRIGTMCCSTVPKSGSTWRISRQSSAASATPAYR